MFRVYTPNGGCFLEPLLLYFLIFFRRAKKTGKDPRGAPGNKFMNPHNGLGDGGIEMSTYFLHPDSIRKLFDTIAPTYDFLNHLLSLRRDFYWRKMAVRELKGVGGWILDIATGTGDVAIEIIQQNGYQKKVFGLDFSEPMIKRARQKILRKGFFQSIALSRGDAIDLPFRENTFSASIIAFGLRNIPNKEQAL